MCLAAADVLVPQRACFHALRRALTLPPLLRPQHTHRYAAELTAQPRLLEPTYLVEIQCPEQVRD